MATEESFPVKVYIYDISKGLARALSQGFIGKCCTNADENSVDLGLAVSKTKQSHNHYFWDEMVCLFVYWQNIPDI